MDPQQRLLLEVGVGGPRGRRPVVRSRLHGSRTGVFVGLCAATTSRQLLLGAGPGGLSTPTCATGNAHSVAAGRISYLLGLQGPSLAVDTACSSSLVAVHLACQSLRARRVRWRSPAA